MRDALEPLVARTSSDTVEIPCHSMRLVHGLEVPWSQQQRHTGLGLTSLFELADDFRDHSAPSLASDGTTGPIMHAARHEDGAYALGAQLDRLPPDSCCESDGLFLMEMT